MRTYTKTANTRWLSFSTDMYNSMYNTGTGKMLNLDFL